jgi:hypothetical protein
MRTWRARVLLVVAGVLGAVLPAQAAPAPQQVTRAYAFDGRGTGVLVVRGTVEAPRGGWFALVAGDASGKGKAPDAVYFPQVVDLDPSAPHTYGRAGRRDVCADPVTTCTVSRDGASLSFLSVFVVAGDEETESHVRYWVAAQGAQVRVRETLVGWTRTTAGTARRVSDGGADGLGLAGGPEPAKRTGVLLRATAGGGTRGSIAVAVPPCDVAGAGPAVLAGPGVTDPQACPTGAFAAVTRRAGPWTLTGPSAGASSSGTRLLVLDL